jgi:monoamine oxidase
MNRKNFIELTLGLAGIAGCLPSCSTKKKIKGSIAGASHSIGHLLRDKQFSQPSQTSQNKVVIVGGGISGLSAARHLYKNGITDFVLLDLEKQTGGNAAYGRNDISAYPWGAHYIPVPNNDLSEYLSFLEECNVITGKSDTGLPVYNEQYLCFDPQERLYINGRWQDGLIPNFGVPDKELKQIETFLQLMEQYRYQKGKDGKDAFAIPVDDSSKDPDLLLLDQLTMKEWMQQHGFTGEHLHRYINYCCRDDFGTPHHTISAWAGIHYFASRKGKGSNAEHGDILTWPQGNGFLAEHLQEGFISAIHTGSLATKVFSTDTGVTIEWLDVKENKLKALETEQCILAVPQFIASRLLNDDQRRKKVKDHLHYAPWMVANLVVNKLEERSGAPLSWDNVIHESNSLGYVEATHELLQQNTDRKNLTYYLPLTGESVDLERKAAQKKTHEAWVDLIMTDLQKVHPNIRQATEEVNIVLWGHAMAQPLPGLIHSDIRKHLSASIENKIHFAHTDLAGISIFEEAFYQGLSVAKKVMANIK